MRGLKYAGMFIDIIDPNLKRKADAAIDGAGWYPSRDLGQRIIEYINKTEAVSVNARPKQLIACWNLMFAPAIDESSWWYENHIIYLNVH